MRPATTTLLSAVKYLLFFAAVAALLTTAVTSYRSGACSPLDNAKNAAGVTAWGPLGVLCDGTKWFALPPAKQLDVARMMYKETSHNLLPEHRQRMPISTDPTAYDRHPTAFYDVAADAVISDSRDLERGEQGQD